MTQPDHLIRPVGDYAPGTTLYQGRYRIDLLLTMMPTRALYRGWDMRANRAVSIVEFAAGDAGRAGRALERAAPLLEHDHAILTPIQVIFVDHQALHFALALGGGQTLEHIIAGRAGPIAPATALRWAVQAAEGVEYLNRQFPTWHLGDLSASSLLITAEDRVQPLGFDLPLGLQTPETLEAALPVGAAAPELRRGVCDARSDVFALANTLHLLLTQRLWRPDDDPEQETLAELRPDLSRTFVATIMRGLAPAPEQRWEDAGAFRRALQTAQHPNYPLRSVPLWTPTPDDPADSLSPTLVMTRSQLLAVPPEPVAPTVPRPAALPASLVLAAAGPLVFAPLAPVAAPSVAPVAAPGPIVTRAAPPLAFAAPLVTRAAAPLAFAPPPPVNFVLVHPEPPPAVISQAAPPLAFTAPAPEPLPAPPDFAASQPSGQMIVARYPDPLLPPAAPTRTRTPTRPRGTLLGRLRDILAAPSPPAPLATGTIVLPRQMYPQSVYTILVRLQRRPPEGHPAPESSPAWHEGMTLVDVSASSEAFYLPVKRLALQLPAEGGQSEGMLSVTALRPSPAGQSDALSFTFHAPDGTVLHEHAFIGEVHILSAGHAASGAAMVTLVHALAIPGTT